MAQEEESCTFKCVVVFRWRKLSPTQRPGFLFAADANARDVKSSARVKIKRDRQSGGQPGGLVLPDKGRGIWGMGALIRLPSFEGEDARLASVLWDSVASALAYSLLP